MDARGQTNAADLSTNRQQMEDIQEVPSSNSVTPESSQGVESPSPSSNEQQEHRGQSEQSKHLQHEGPLSLIIQGPSGILYVGTENTKGKNQRDGEEGADPDGEQAPHFVFEPAVGPTTPGLEAIHITMPDVDRRGDSNRQLSVDVRGLESILDPQHAELSKRRKRCFVFLLLLGSAFYIVVYAVGIVENRNQSEASAFQETDSEESNAIEGIANQVDSLAKSMLTAGNAVLATAYLVLYLALDMIAFSGAVLENTGLLTLYMFVEVCLVCISALHSIKPYLIYRIIIILLAAQVRQGILTTRRAWLRLQLRIMGETLPEERNGFREMLVAPVRQVSDLFRNSYNQFRRRNRGEAARETEMPPQSSSVVEPSNGRVQLA